MSEISQRYRSRAEAFERKIAAVLPEQWSNQSPCEEWTARDVVSHIIDMHAAMLAPLGRELSSAPPVADDPLAAFQAARADVQAILDDPELAGVVHDPGGGPKTVDQHIDQVVSADMVIHGWDLARATRQDETIEPADVELLWATFLSMPPELLEMMRTPDAFGPGVKVLGPEVKVPDDAPMAHRLLGVFGRDPY